MAKKSLGYVELEWSCPNCGTRNPGPQKTCLSCGMSQPEDVEFKQPAQETLVEDEAKITEAKAGPDIHCYYCGSRNPATAETCSQCGADLTEGSQRQSGQILGAHKTGPAEPINCPACGTPNDPSAPKCVQCGASLTAVQAGGTPAPASAPSRGMAEEGPVKVRSRRGLFGGITGIIILLLVCSACITLFVLYNQTEEASGTVSGVTWSRTIEIEGQVPVSQEAWHDEVPAEAVVGTCTQKVRRTQPQPAPNAREVCGTPYTVDTGSGFGEVVQDCQYEVLEEYCKYTVDEWQMVDEERLSGNDYNPRWPDPFLKRNQRLGEREERYQITFNAEDGQYTYVTSSAELFDQAEIGSRWLLEINTFNTVTGIEPAR